MPLLTETMLRHLYAWHMDLLLLAAMKHPGSAPVEQFAVNDDWSDASAHERQNALFLALARTAGNPEHVAALQALSERLEPAQRLEQFFLDETEAETNDILRALQTRDRKGLRSSLIRYHRRRLRIVPELLARMTDGAWG